MVPRDGIEQPTRWFSLRPFLRFTKDLLPKWINFVHLLFKDLAGFSRTHRMPRPLRYRVKASDVDVLGDLYRAIDVEEAFRSCINSFGC